MTFVSVLVYLLPLAAAASAVALALFRPGRGAGWAGLALVGAVGMFGLVISYMGVVESGMTLRDPGLVVALAIGGSGAALFAYSVRKKVKAGRRPTLGACAACGYDRAGLGRGAACPECGAGRGENPVDSGVLGRGEG